MQCLFWGIALFNRFAMLEDMKLATQNIKQQPFRILFLLTGLSGLLLVSVWTLFWIGKLPLTLAISPILWHGHEMLFGFAGIAIAGFLSAAVVNWTGYPSIQNGQLLALCLCWLLGRFVFLVPWPAVSAMLALADISFWLIFLFWVASAIFSAENERNYKVVAVVSTLGGLNILFYASHFAWVLNLLHSKAALLYLFNSLALFAIVMLVQIIGGRIIPIFTRNWIRSMRPDLSSGPVTFNRFDQIAVIASGLFLALLFLLRNTGQEPLKLALGLFGLLSAALQFIRWLRWRMDLALPEPLLWSLHLGFLWYPIGLLFAGLYFLFDNVPFSTAIHSLTVGLLTTLIIAVSSRAARGHTQRPLQSDGLFTTSILLIQVSAIIRLAAAFHLNLFQLGPQAWVLTSGIVWSAAFICYLSSNFRILLGPTPQPQNQPV